MSTVRWNIAVSSDTDQSVRLFLASQGGGRKGDLSRFIEEAVRSYIFERAVEQAKAANANVNEDDLSAIVAEAVQWARGH
jgi:Ribbon-helix-helix domain